ncbi:DUF302 domain-containing protein [Lacticigenium naphthae]|uniref:DUF302 domain-containing protein n=1 Tax=Lacticigenium naphthae TaxID=515351 RepID=UPI00041B670B|nr:DUF302 domain-containing protein [Lacticigenium naphthae]
MDIQFKVETSKDFASAIAALKEEMSQYGFGVLWEMNFKDKLQAKGLDFDKNFQIMEACNPKQAKVVLDKDIEAGYFLPCKVVVYEKDEKVFVGMLRPTLLMDMMDVAGLEAIAQEVEEDLKKAIEAVK